MPSPMRPSPGRDSWTGRADLTQDRRSFTAAIRARAEKDAADELARSAAAVRQAARDVQLLLKSRVMELFERAFRNGRRAALSVERHLQKVSLTAQREKELSLPYRPRIGRDR